MNKISPKKIKFLEKIINEVIKKPSSPAWGWGKESNERTRSVERNREVISKDDEEIQSDNG